MSIYDTSVILITGSRGFLGHHVIAKLKEYRDSERQGISILTPTREHLDLLNPGQIKFYLNAGDPDIVAEAL